MSSLPLLEEVIPIYSHAFFCVVPVHSAHYVITSDVKCTGGSRGASWGANAPAVTKIQENLTFFPHKTKTVYILSERVCLELHTHSNASGSEIRWVFGTQRIGQIQIQTANTYSTDGSRERPGPMPPGSLNVRNLWKFVISLALKEKTNISSFIRNKVYLKLHNNAQGSEIRNRVFRDNWVRPRGLQRPKQSR